MYPLYPVLLDSVFSVCSGMYSISFLYSRCTPLFYGFAEGYSVFASRWFYSVFFGLPLEVFTRQNGHYRGSLVFESMVDDTGRYKFERFGFC